MKHLKTAAIMLCLAIGLAASVARAANSPDQAVAAPTATVIGIYEANEKPMLVPAFINAVNTYLRRYAPKLEIRQDNYVKMSAKYQYWCNIELFIRDKEYEIVVTVAQSRYSRVKAQSVMAGLSANVLKAMKNVMAK